jgi:MFS family permease
LRVPGGLNPLGADRDVGDLLPQCLSLRQAVGFGAPLQTAGLGDFGDDRGGRCPRLWQPGRLVWGGIAPWGLHMGMTQGLLATMVANTAPGDLLGTAYGFFNLVSGLGMLMASALAGVFWDQLGASSTFLVGAAFSSLALAAIILRRTERAALW